MGVNDIKEAGRSAADTVRKYIEDVAELRDQLEALAAHRVVLLRQKLAAGQSWVGPLHDEIQPKAKKHG